MSTSNLNYQLELYPPSLSTRIVNVASVPKLSPFRYPGGKTWLIPRIRQWLTSLSFKPSVLIEPFAGGGIVGLISVAEKLVDKVLLVELDEQIASVWKTILNGGHEWLANEILTFNLNEKNVKEVLLEQTKSIKKIAFQTILKNRTFHGGILAPGSGFIKYGENGKGLLSRWYPQTLANRIRFIASLRDRIDFIQGDGIAAINKYMKNDDAVFFIDPPYTAAGKKAGKRLYTHHTLDHEELFKLVSSLKGDFLITYDNSQELVSMAHPYKFDVKKIAMKNTHHAEMSELLIGRDLSWVK